MNRPSNSLRDTLAQWTKGLNKVRDRLAQPDARRWMERGRPLVAFVLWLAIVGGATSCSIAIAAESDDSFDVSVLADKLTSWSENALDGALLLAAVGFASMALVDLLKAVLLVRPAYQWLMVEKWLRGASPTVRDDVRDQLFQLTAGDPRAKWVWLDQRTETMFAQLQDAGHVALQNDAVYGDFCRFLAGPVTAAKGESDDSVLARRRFVARRRIEALQTQMNWYWARGNQALGILVSFALLTFLLRDVVKSLGYGAPEVFVMALLGGLIAPFAKDLTSQLTRVRSALS